MCVCHIETYYTVYTSKPYRLLTDKCPIVISWLYIYIYHLNMYIKTHIYNLYK